MKYLLIIALGMFMSFHLTAQKTFDLICINGRCGSPQAYDSIYTGKATEYGLTINLAAPVKFSEKSMWYNSVNYFFWNVGDNVKMAEDIANPVQIHGILL